MLGKLKHGKKQGVAQVHTLCRPELVYLQDRAISTSIAVLFPVPRPSVILALGPWIASTHPCKKEEMRASFTLSCSSSLATIKRAESH